MNKGKGALLIIATYFIVSTMTYLALSHLPPLLKLVYICLALEFIIILRLGLE